MQRRVVIILASLAGGALLLAIGALVYILRPTAAPSGEITAIPVEVIIAETPIPTTTSSISDAEATNTPTSGPQTFELVQSESQARFIIQEVLRGQVTTVVGVTSLVAAQILVDLDNPAATQLGAVTVNARDLTTDQGSRNRAIRNEILDTALYEFITFTPTQLLGLPVSVAFGQSFSFQVIGDLTIRDITNQVTFEVTATLESEARLSGLASTTIQRNDYSLTIPNVPQVASVQENVVLEIEFVAIAQ
ncbi:MAG: YceI family protein [Chloroflexi bacterium]|nr:YceI family protein [Chloroflexota bacterium]MQC26643.1 YceI family protein [Chloroflexota bacterium]